MNASDVIEIYIEDTVRNLPRHERADVAAELRTLFHEELQAQSANQGHPPTAEMAIALVRAYGKPAEVAARYYTPWTIIAPVDSKSFVRAALIGIGTLVFLGHATDPRPWAEQLATSIFKNGIMAWLGLLLVYFGVKNWIRLSWPSVWPWKPRGRKSANRIGIAILFPITAALLVCYSAPKAFLGAPPERTHRIWINAHERYIDDPHWDPPHWTPEQMIFHKYRLTVLAGLLASLLALSVLVAIRGEWRRSTLRLNLALHIACLYLITTFIPDITWHHDRDVSLLGATAFRLILLTYTFGLAFYLHSELGRIDRVERIHVKLPLTFPRTPAPISPHG